MMCTLLDSLAMVRFQLFPAPDYVPTFKLPRGAERLALQALAREKAHTGHSRDGMFMRTRSVGVAWSVLRSAYIHSRNNSGGYRVLTSGRAA